MSKKKIEDIDKNFAQKSITKKGAEWQWISATNRRMTVRGLAWFEENKRSFSRLPMRAEKIVRPDVWTLGQAPASARVCFKTNSTRLAIRMQNHAPCNMLHFAITGSDGAFIYEGVPGHMKPWNMTAPFIGQTDAEKEIITGMKPEIREFTIYLPLYAPLKSLEIGLDPGAKILKPTPHRRPKPLVFYGTSITQGGCSSTAGGDFVSAVGRKLDMDVVNLGFSGNGWGEPEMAHLMSEIDAEAFILDYAANTNAENIKKSLPKFIAILRKKHPTTPIIIMSKIHYYWESYNTQNRQGAEKQRDAIIAAYHAARTKGDTHIHFIDGWSLCPHTTDGSLVDGVHPTSHGFMVMADLLTPQLGYILNA